MKSGFGDCFAYFCICDQNNNFVAAKLLLEKGADPLILNSSGDLAVCIAAKLDNVDVLNAILTDAPDQLNFFNPFKKSLLHICCEYDLFKCAELLLITYKQSVSMRDFYGRIPLLLTVHGEETESSLKILDLLLKSGSDLFTSDESSRSASTICKYLGKKRFLIERFEKLFM